MPQLSKAKRKPAPQGLPTETAHARRFGKARIARSSALLEDYVELIADLLAASGDFRSRSFASIAPRNRFPLFGILF